jgi:ABC-2 type transport system ATP-binding protein
VLVTHFMDEAERLCDRVAVMVGGRVVAEDTPTGLIDRYGGGTRVRFAAGTTGLDGIDRLPGVTEARNVDGVVAVRGAGRFLTALGHHLYVSGRADAELSVERAGLEDAYVALLDSAPPVPAGTLRREAS